MIVIMITISLSIRILHASQCELLQSYNLSAPTNNHIEYMYHRANIKMCVQ